MSHTVPLAELRWRCRRGMLELDVFLQRFLEHGYLGLDTKEQQAFYRLLEFQDQELLEVLLQQSYPADQELHSIVEAIRSTAALPL